MGNLDLQRLPKHIAIIMDGNGRWATKRFMPRVAGHSEGLEAVRKVVEECVKQNVEYLTLFAFSSENWRRPPEEVGFLMKLFLKSLRGEVGRLAENGIQLRLIGDLTQFDQSIQEMIAFSEEKTAHCKDLTLTIAANYGGRWDMIQAAKAWQTAHPEEDLSSLTEEGLAVHLSTADAPEMDLLIRTGGESRISNFMLWQAAYAELFFTDDLWPDFSPARLKEAMVWFAGRDRRFGSSAPL